MNDDFNAHRIQFDWFNHLTTLSLIILGGIIGFVPRDPMPLYAIAAMMLVAFGGAVALAQSQRIVNGKKPHKGWQRFFSDARFANWSLSVGAGVFLGGILIN